MKKLICFLLPGLLILSCKKDKKTDPTPASNSTNSIAFSGMFITGRTATFNNGVLYPNLEECIVEFFTSPDMSTGVEVDSVSLNGVRLKYNYDMYYDSTFSIPFSPSNWVVGGANGIPSFTFTNNDPIPSFTGYAAWPDTIFRNQTVVIPLNGVSGADDIQVTLNSDTTSINQTMTPGTNGVTFSASSTGSLNPNSYSSLSLYLTKTREQIIGGKKMVFYCTYELDHTVVVKL